MVLPVVNLKAGGGLLTMPLRMPGRYAVALVHDENGNGQLDKLLFVPKEGFGFSRNPAIRFGPPGFDEASFVVNGGVSEQKVTMKYSL